MTYVIYGSSTGNTQHAAETIAELLGDATAVDVTAMTEEMLESSERLILGTSTWGAGELQDDWEKGLELIEEADLSGKQAAVFGLGDQEDWGESFVDGMRTLYDALRRSGAVLIGEWEEDDYDFSDSLAYEDDHFIGLPLDEDNQADLTPERIERWVEQLKSEF